MELKETVMIVEGKIIGIAIFFHLRYIYIKYLTRMKYP